MPARMAGSALNSSRECAWRQCTPAEQCPAGEQSASCGKDATDILMSGTVCGGSARPPSSALRGSRVQGSGRGTRAFVWSGSGQAEFGGQCSVRIAPQAP